jgi:hypothetical protein
VLQNGEVQQGIKVSADDWSIGSEVQAGGWHFSLLLPRVTTFGRARPHEVGQQFAVVVVTPSAGGFQPISGIKLAESKPHCTAN